MKSYTEKVRIKSYHVDRKGELGTVQVFNFLQEAAFRHSVIDKFGQLDLDEMDMVWVLSRMKVVFLEAVQLGETIELNSWVRSINGALSERDFELTHNGKSIIRATSLWICLEVKLIKPVRIPDHITARMVENNSEDLFISTAKIPTLNKVSSSIFYKIQPSDIDMVNHTNNVVYVRIGLDAINSNKLIKEIDVNYLNQSFEGENLEIKTEKDLGEPILQEIVNADGEVVCRLRYTI
ncbi:MAG: thioesterase [Cyclobacteriaceae bacterium]|nr:thioesterase [Cyclobacteriaceae bacterium]